MICCKTEKPCALRPIGNARTYIERDGIAVLVDDAFVLQMVRRVASVQLLLLLVIARIVILVVIDVIGEFHMLFDVGGLFTGIVIILVLQGKASVEEGAGSHRRTSERWRSAAEISGGMYSTESRAKVMESGAVRAWCGADEAEWPDEFDGWIELRCSCGCALG